MKLLILIFVVIISCSSREQFDCIQSAKELYEKAKEKEGSLDYLFNISVKARGIDNKDSIYRVTRIGVKLKEESVTIPGIKEYMTDEEIKKLPFSENIEKYASLTNLTYKDAYDSIKSLSIKVIKLMDELKAYEIYGTPHDNGEYIKFTIASNCEVIYVPDTSKVYHPYWKSYFRTDNKFDDKWYYRKVETSNN